MLIATDDDRRFRGKPTTVLADIEALPDATPKVKHATPRLLVLTPPGDGR